MSHEDDSKTCCYQVDHTQRWLVNGFHFTTEWFRTSKSFHTKSDHKKSETKEPKFKKEIENEINRRTHNSFTVLSMLLYSYHSYTCVDLLFHFYNIYYYIYWIYDYIYYINEPCIRIKYYIRYSVW